MCIRDSLALMLDRRGSILARETLLRDIWGHEYKVNDMRTVDTLVRRLRVKLGKYSTHLESIRGKGYRFNAATEKKLA